MVQEVTLADWKWRVGAAGVIQGDWKCTQGTGSDLGGQR